MKAQCFSRKLQEIVVGVILILALGGSETLGKLFQAQLVSAGELSPLANGTYLYGEDPQPDQVGKGYVVFSHQNGQVVGAFYYPNSEFDCFAGSLKENMLDVKAVAAGDLEIVEVEVNLLNLHSIQAISGNDRRILSVCQQEAARLFGRQLAHFLSSLLGIGKPEPSLSVVSV